MIKDEKYQVYATSQVRDVELQNTKHLINLFMDLASLNMGSSYEKKLIDRVIEIVTEDYGYLPVCYIASAFQNGSMGKYGAGRLVPRIINDWLKEISEDYNRITEHKKREVYLNKKEDYFDLQKYPLGSALIKKWEWRDGGRFTDEELDKIPLKELAEKIGKGINVTPEMFGL